MNSVFNAGKWAGRGRQAGEGMKAYSGAHRPSVPATSERIAQRVERFARVAGGSDELAGDEHPENHLISSPQ